MNGSPPERKWQVALDLVLLIFVPTAFGLTFYQAFLRRPWMMAGFVVLYESFILVMRFTSKVWDRLENQWSEKIANALAQAVEIKLSRYTSRYLHYIVYRHRAFDVKGLGTQGIYTLQMEKVFVDLSIIPQPAHSTSTNLLGRSNEIIPGKRYSIHDFLSKEELQLASLAILGPPGSGKTTLLKHVAITLVQRRLPRKYWRIPILIFLREFANEIYEKPDISLAALIDASMNASHLAAPKGWFEKKLRRGSCLVMLDGLDEIPKPSVRKKVAEWLDHQISILGPKNRFIITSRPFGYKSNPIDNVSMVLEVRPFSNAQVRKFVHNWYLANESMAAGNSNDPGIEMAARTGAEDLLARLDKTQDLAELAVNPLLLTMIATVHRFRSSLPGRRVELYSEICDVFLGNRQRAKGIELGDGELTPGQKRRVIEPLAYEMMHGNLREMGRTDVLKAIKGTLALVTQKMTPEDFLKDVEDFSGVLLERENSVYSFAHLTFQEYLAAAHIRMHRLESEVIKHIDDPWWHEVLRLYSAQGDASPIINACLLQEKPSIEAMALATHCMEEAFEVKPELRVRLEKVLSTTNTEDARRLFAKQRLKLRLRKLLRTDDRWIMDDSLITVAEYELFAEHQSARGLNVTPDHWPTFAYSPENAARSILGVRQSDAQAFCEWLTEEEGNGCIFRLPTTAEVETNALHVVSRATPLYHWTKAEGEHVLVNVTELSDSRISNLLPIIEADLECVLQGDLATAAVVEWAREDWAEDRLRKNTPKNVTDSLRVEHAMDLDEISEMQWTMPDRTVWSDGAKTTLSFAKTVLLAATWELSRKPKSDLADSYLAAALASIEEGVHFSQDRLSEERQLAANLMWLLLRYDERLDRLASGNYLHECAKLSERMKLSRQRHGAIGAPLQSEANRRQVAAALASIFSPAVNKANMHELSWNRERSERPNLSLRRRSLIRLLTVVVSWMAAGLTDVQDTYAATDSPALVGAAQVLLQVFLDMCLLEERIYGSAPAVEGIRIVREMTTDTLAATYLEEEGREIEASAVPEQRFDSEGQIPSTSPLVGVALEQKQ